MSVWTTYDPTTRAPTRDGAERSTAPAHSSTSSRSGKRTTIGFQGLTRAPSTPSEYVVADGPAAASTATSTATHRAAHRARAGVVRRRTTATQASAASPFNRAAPTKSERSLEPSTR